MTALVLQEFVDLVAKHGVAEDQRAYEPAHITFNYQENICWEAAPYLIACFSVTLGNGQFRCPLENCHFWTGDRRLYNTVRRELEWVHALRAV